MLPRSPAALLPVSFLLALGCGGESTRTKRSSDEPVAGTQGGRRLQAVFIESADGFGVFRHFYDTKLELTCNFEAIEGDTWRCTPDGTGAARVSELVYTDAECTTPHAALYPTSHGLSGCTPPRYGVASDSCGGTPSVFAIGSASSAGTRYRLVDGACVASDLGTDGLTSLFAVTPISLDEFQVARLNVGDETEGIVPLDLRSNDGAAVRLGFRDALEEFDCRLVGSDDDGRCVPAELGLVGYLFADTECTQPAAMSTSCGAARTEMRFAQDSGADGTVYHRGGARLSSSYTGSPGRCEPAVSSVAFEVGPAVPITRFAAGRRTTLGGKDIAVTIETVGTASMPAHTLRSTAYAGYECHFARGVDGQLRCMPPPETLLDHFFADAACTEPVEYTQAEVLALEVPGVCPREVRVFSRGDRHVGPVYAVADGVCALAFERPPNDSERTPYHAFPTELHATEFVPLFEVTR